MSSIGMFSILFFSVSSFAKMPLSDGKIANFRPGEYSLSKGQERLCGTGSFEFEEDSSNLVLGAKHFINAKAGDVVKPCEEDVEKNCSNSIVVTAEVAGPLTTIVEKDTEKQGEKVIQVTTKELKIRKEILMLKITEKGEDNETYSCTWKFKKALPAKGADEKN